MNETIKIGGGENGSAFEVKKKKNTIKYLLFPLLYLLLLSHCLHDQGHVYITFFVNIHMFYFGFEMPSS